MGQGGFTWVRVWWLRWGGSCRSGVRHLFGRHASMCLFHLNCKRHSLCSYHNLVISGCITGEAAEHFGSPGTDGQGEYSCQISLLVGNNVFDHIPLEKVSQEPLFVFYIQFQIR